MRRTWLVLAVAVAPLGCGGSNVERPRPVHAQRAEPVPQDVAIPSEKYDQIQDTFRRKTVAVADCYTDEMERGGNKKVEGNVRLTMMLHENGSATDVKVEQSTLHSPPIEECVKQRVATWAFPELPRSTPFTWTFQFKPAY